MREYNMISGGIDMNYQSTLILKLSIILLRNSKRKKKIKNIINGTKKNS